MRALPPIPPGVFSCKENSTHQQVGAGGIRRRRLLGFAGRRLQKRPRILANIQDSDDLNPQGSSGSVKNSGGQSSSLAPLASLNLRSKAGVAWYVRLVAGGGIATIDRRPLPSLIMYSPYGASATKSSGRTIRFRLSCFAMVTDCAIMRYPIRETWCQWGSRDRAWLFNKQGQTRGLPVL